MTVMTQPIPRFAWHPHPAPATAALVVIFWLAAAVLVSAAHAALDPRSTAGSATATLTAILLAAFCYTRLVARQSGITHALGVGIAWLVLSIVTELALTAHAGHGWVLLLGSPDHPLLRNISLFAWIFAPALFARGESE
jgi:hypothetical protein